MPGASQKISLYIEATPLLDRHMGGVGHMTLQLIKSLSSDQHREQATVYLVVPIDKLKLLQERTKELSVQYRPLPFPAKILYGLWKFNMVPPLDLYLGKGVYFFPNFRNWPVWRSRSITCVHDLTFHIFPEYVSPANQRFLSRNMPSWLRHTDTVMAVSQNTKNDIVKYYDFPPERINVLYNGINLQEFYPRPKKEIDHIRQKYGAPKQYIVFLSTVEPRKNIDTLLEAYNRLPVSYRKKLGLLLVGASGWLNEATVARIKRMQAQGYDIVWPQVFVPNEDLPALLSGAAFMVHPAFYEGFGISPLQAMACSTPVIVADNSSLPEVVGKSGLYFNAEDVDGLVEKIRFAIDHPNDMHTLGRKGQRRARQFTWEKTGERLMGCVVKLAGKVSK